MNFAEKLAKLTEGKNKQRVGVDAGLAPTTVSDYIAKGSSPKADKALALARVLNVPLEWLVDDQQDWPPTKDSEQNALSDHDLMLELSRRFIRAVHEYLAAQRIANEVDWNRATDEVLATAADAPLPPYARRARAAIFAVYLAFNRMQQAFDVKEFAILHAKEIEGREAEPAEIEAAWGAHTFADFDQSLHVEKFQNAIKDRADWKNAPEREAVNQYVQMGQMWTALADQHRPRPKKKAEIQDRVKRSVIQK